MIAMFRRQLVVRDRILLARRIVRHHRDGVTSEPVPEVVGIAIILCLDAHLRELVNALAKYP